MRRQKTAIFFIVLGISLIAIAFALNIGWIILNLREALMLTIGVLFFTLIITGLILNTIFLVREIRRGEQQDAFLNAVTHELKTPIAAIKLYLDTLRSREVTEEKRREFYDIIDAEAGRLLNTVEQVLIAGRAKTSGKQENLAELDLGAILKNAIGVIESRYNLPAGVIRILEAADDPKVFGNADELETAFTNLLDNAVKYSGDDRKISVRIRSGLRGGRVEVIIRDNGIGIAPSELKRIFKRFYRSSGQAAKRVKGTGLGLFIVKSVIENPGAESLRKVAAKAAEQHFSYVCHKPEESFIQEMRILIVEDEEHLAEGLRFNLEAEGYTAMVCNSGESALEKLSGEAFDLVILDVMLPGIDGFEVARKLREAGNYVPVLMLTALGRPEEVIRGFEAGADDYLPKPFDLQIFLARIKGLIRRRDWSQTIVNRLPEGSMTVNGRLIDLANLRLTNGGQVLELTQMEAKLIEYFIENPGRAISRKEILLDVWGLVEDTDTRAIDNFIVRLRKYLEDEPNNPKVLKTVRGVGYRLDLASDYNQSES